jgi:hypothetical protein
MWAKSYYNQYTAQTQTQQRAYIVEVVEAENSQFRFVSTRLYAASTYALLPPTVLFAAAMAKLCPDSA